MLATTPAGPGGAFCIDTLIFNLRKPPFRAQEVRQAFAHAINREQILAQVRFGRGRVATGPIASMLAWAYAPQVPRYAYDVAQAVELLDRGGYPAAPTGPRLRVVFVHASPFAKTAEVIRENLGRLGVEVDLQTLEVNAANERIFIKQNFDLAIGSYCNGPDPEIGVTRAYVSSNIKPIPFANGAAYQNPQTDALFHRAARTIDLAERAQLYAQIQDILVREVPYWWLIETEGTRAYRKGIHGLRLWAGDLLEQAWIERPR
jgi:peptide/nickel transport system substrate-binding protein